MMANYIRGDDNTIEEWSLSTKEQSRSKNSATASN